MVIGFTLVIIAFAFIHKADTGGVIISCYNIVVYPVEDTVDTVVAVIIYAASAGRNPVVLCVVIYKQ